MIRFPTYDCTSQTVSAATERAIDSKRLKGIGSACYVCPRDRPRDLPSFVAQCPFIPAQCHESDGQTLAWPIRADRTVTRGLK